MNFNVIIVGGGAAGFFNAINMAKMCPDLSIAILERGGEFLSKVRISGGGRCNVTHAEFIPKPLTEHYPRGEKELLGPFHKFMTGDVMQWFEDRGVDLKIEEDNRIFPVSDSSETIIDCFLAEAKKYNINLFTKTAIAEIERNEDRWFLKSKTEHFICDDLVICTGSNPKMWKLLEQLGHKTIAPVPSLFTFNIKDNRIMGLPGVATQGSIKLLDLNGDALQIPGANGDESSGPILITHWGISGPAVLKLSAIAARVLHAMEYNFLAQVNWLDHFSFNEAVEIMKDFKLASAKQTVIKRNPFDLPKRLWNNLVLSSQVSENVIWADINKQQIEHIAQSLTQCTFRVSGKSTFKDEFTTAGGVDLTEVDFTTFASKICPDLYLAGEVLNIDAVTGGFNFQNAWTGGYLAAEAIAKKYNA